MRVQVLRCFWRKRWPWVPQINFQDDTAAELDRVLKDKHAGFLAKKWKGSTKQEKTVNKGTEETTAGSGEVVYSSAQFPLL